MDALIEDKIAPSDWGRHLGQSPPALSTRPPGADADRQGAGGPRTGRRRPPEGRRKRLGEPVIRTAVTPGDEGNGPPVRAGETIEKAMDRARELEARGYTYSYDMLGEAARTEADARRYHLAYSKANHRHRHRRARQRHPHQPRHFRQALGPAPALRVAKRARVMEELVPRVRALAGWPVPLALASTSTQRRPIVWPLSLEVIEAVLSDFRAEGLGWLWRRRAGLWPPRRCGDRLAVCAGTAVGPPHHGAAGERRLLGRRGETGAGSCLPSFPCSSPASRRRTSATSPTPASCWA